MPLQLNRAITTFLHTLLCSSAVSAQSWAATLAASVGEGILGLPKALEATGLAGKLDKPINRISRQIARGLHSLSVLSGNLSQAIRVGSLVQHISSGRTALVLEGTPLDQSVLVIFLQSGSNTPAPEERPLLLPLTALSSLETVHPTMPKTALFDGLAVAPTLTARAVLDSLIGLLEALENAPQLPNPTVPTGVLPYLALVRRKVAEALGMLFADSSAGWLGLFLADEPLRTRGLPLLVRTSILPVATSSAISTCTPSTVAQLEEILQSQLHPAIALLPDHEELPKPGESPKAAPKPVIASALIADSCVASLWKDTTAHFVSLAICGRCHALVGTALCEGCKAGSIRPPGCPTCGKPVRQRCPSCRQEGGTLFMRGVVSRAEIEAAVNVAARDINTAIIAVPPPAAGPAFLPFLRLPFQTISSSSPAELFFFNPATGFLQRHSKGSLTSSGGLQAYFVGRETEQPVSLGSVAPPQFIPALIGPMANEGMSPMTEPVPMECLLTQQGLKAVLEHLHRFPAVALSPVGAAAGPVQTSPQFEAGLQVAAQLSLTGTPACAPSPIYQPIAELYKTQRFAPISLRTAHPFVANLSYSQTLVLPVARSYTVTFDAHSHSHNDDVLTVSTKMVSNKRSGSSGWKPILIEGGGDVTFLWQPKGDRQDWGWDCTITAEQIANFSMPMTDDRGEVISPKVFETGHNYENNMNDRRTFSQPGADAYEVEFDPRCSTENNCDWVSVHSGEDWDTPLYRFSGKIGENQKSRLYVDAQVVGMRFTSDGSVVDWGVRALIHPCKRARFASYPIELCSYLLAAARVHAGSRVLVLGREIGGLAALAAHAVGSEGAVVVATPNQRIVYPSAARLYRSFCLTPQAQAENPSPSICPPQLRVLPDDILAGDHPTLRGGFDAVVLTSPPATGQDLLRIGTRFGRPNMVVVYPSVSRQFYAVAAPMLASWHPPRDLPPRGAQVGLVVTPASNPDWMHVPPERDLIHGEVVVPTGPASSPPSAADQALDLCRRYNVCSSCATTTPLPQFGFDCLTCGLTGDCQICECCARRCHPTHDVRLSPKQSSFFCSCPSFRIRNMTDQKATWSCVSTVPLSLSINTADVDSCRCTGLPHGASTAAPATQLAYACKSCRSADKNGLMVCARCAVGCHVEHPMVLLGERTFLCQCTQCHGQLVPGQPLAGVLVGPPQCQFDNSTIPRGEAFPAPAVATATATALPVMGLGDLLVPPDQPVIPDEKLNLVEKKDGPGGSSGRATALPPHILGMLHPEMAAFLRSASESPALTPADLSRGHLVFVMPTFMAMPKMTVPMMTQPSFVPADQLSKFFPHALPETSPALPPRDKIPADPWLTLRGRVGVVVYVGSGAEPMVCVEFSDHDRALRWKRFVPLTQLAAVPGDDDSALTKRVPTAGRSMSLNELLATATLQPAAARALVLYYNEVQSCQAQTAALDAFMRVFSQWPSGLAGVPALTPSIFGAQSLSTLLALFLASRQRVQSASLRSPALDGFEETLSNLLITGSPAHADTSGLSLAQKAALPDDVASVASLLLQYTTMLFSPANRSGGPSMVSVATPGALDYSQAVIIETPHPYQNNMDLHLEIPIPGAKGLLLRFDGRCSTETNCDRMNVTTAQEVSDTTRLVMWTGQYNAEHVCYRIPDRDRVWVHFYSDGSNVDVGMKLTIFPEGLGSKVVDAPTPAATGGPVLPSAKEQLSRLVPSLNRLFYGAPLPRESLNLMGDGLAAAFLSPLSPLALSSLRALLSSPQVSPSHPVYSPSTAQALCSSLETALQECSAKKGSAGQALNDVNDCIRLLIRFLSRWPLMEPAQRDLILPVFSKTSQRIAALLPALSSSDRSSIPPRFEAHEYSIIELLVSIRLLTERSGPTNPSEITVCPLYSDALTPLDKLVEVVRINDALWRMYHGKQAHLPLPLIASAFAYAKYDLWVETPHPVVVNGSGEVVHRIEIAQPPWLQDLGVECQVRVEFDPRTALADGDSIMINCGGNQTGVGRGQVSGCTVLENNSNVRGIELTSPRAADLRAPEASRPWGFGAYFQPSITNIAPIRERAQRMLEGKYLGQVRQMFAAMNSPKWTFARDSDMVRRLNEHTLEHSSQPSVTHPSLLYREFASEQDRQETYVRFYMWRVYNWLLRDVLSCFDFEHSIPRHQADLVQAASEDFVSEDAPVATATATTPATAAATVAASAASVAAPAAGPAAGARPQRALQSDGLSDVCPQADRLLALQDGRLGAAPPAGPAQQPGGGRHQPHPAASALCLPGRAHDLHATRAPLPWPPRFAQVHC
eukprot:GAFH01000692.1.p2 GENE.GAFH01000692.1~~GAFH01000692.1.p2  ORF type:complete len:2290 (-),score=622.35 GAFH01000692.1:1260-8129(-)